MLSMEYFAAKQSLYIYIFNWGGMFLAEFCSRWRNFTGMSRPKEIKSAQTDEMAPDITHKTVIERLVLRYVRIQAKTVGNLWTVAFLSYFSASWSDPHYIGCRSFTSELCSEVEDGSKYLTVMWSKPVALLGPGCNQTQVRFRMLGSEEFGVQFGQYVDFDTSELTRGIHQPNG